MPNPTPPGPAADGPRDGNGSPDFAALEPARVHDLLSHAYATVTGVLARLRESQHVLEHVTVQKLQDSTAKLDEISSATQDAATSIMDGLDRALLLVDAMEEDGAPPSTSGELREELFGVMNHLQFQDITSQQLRYVSSLLREMEAQLAEFAPALDPGQCPPAAPAAAPAEAEAEAGHPTFDPRASVREAEERQALVDSLLPAASRG